MIYDKNNIFAKILRGEINCSKVYEDEDTLAFEDIEKAAPIHVLVIPKGEFIDFSDFVLKENNIKVANFFQKITKITKILDLKGDNYRLITNKGKLSSQSVDHFHVHILGGKQLGKLL